MATTKLSDDAIRELCNLTTRDQAGQHFTAWAKHYEELEAAGLIAINRPVHRPTGIDYDQTYWTVEVTEDGIDVIDANPELHPDD